MNLLYSIYRFRQIRKNIAHSKKCPLTLVLIILLMSTGRAQNQKTIMVPVEVDNKAVRLEMIICQPQGAGPFPTVVLNHGSIGSGRDQRAIKAKVTYFQHIFDFFLKRGWAIVAPMRRGRSGSEGIYDEGFHIDRTKGYTCKTRRSIKGAERALRDIEAAMKVIRTMPFVDTSCIIISGVSRGGILSIAYAGQHPKQVKGVVNFVGGWIGTGCSTAEKINQNIFCRGAQFPRNTIWLYGSFDSYYPLSHSRKNFKAFRTTGGKGEFHAIEVPIGFNGHFICGFPDLWSSLTEDYLKKLTLPYKELNIQSE